MNITQTINMQVAPLIPFFFLLAFQGPIDVAAEEKGRSSFLARFLTLSSIMFVFLWIRSWLHDYERVLALAVRLIYIQIGCSIFGSLGALFNGLLLIDLALGLFALVAIDRSSERLGRTYGVLLICAIILDVQWFILFSRIIWNAEPEKFGILFVFSVKLTMAMQIIGFSTRFFSLFLWIQIYRLGASNVIHRVSPVAVVEDCEAADVGSSLLSPKPYETSEQCSDSNFNSVDSIYDSPFLCTSEVAKKVLPKAVDERNNLRPCETLRKCSEFDDFDDFIYDPPLLPILFQEAKDETCLQKAKEKISASNNNCINEPLQESEALHLNLCSNRQVRIVQVGTAVPRPYIP